MMKLEKIVQKVYNRISLRGSSESHQNAAKFILKSELTQRGRLDELEQGVEMLDNKFQPKSRTTMTDEGAE